MLKALAFAFLALAGCSSKSVYEPQADREGVRKVAQAHMKELRQCYYQTLDEHPASEGKIILVWDLSMDGHAVGGHIENVVGRRGIASIEPCLVMRLSSWQFPRPASGEVTTIRYPLYFSENGKTDFSDAPAAAAPAGPVVIPDDPGQSSGVQPPSALPVNPMVDEDPD